MVLQGQPPTCRCANPISRCRSCSNQVSGASAPLARGRLQALSNLYPRSISTTSISSTPSMEGDALRDECLKSGPGWDSYRQGQVHRAGKGYEPDDFRHVLELFHDSRQQAIVGLDVHLVNIAMPKCPRIHYGLVVRSLCRAPRLLPATKCPRIHYGLVVQDARRILELSKYRAHLAFRVVELAGNFAQAHAPVPVQHGQHGKFALGVHFRQPRVGQLTTQAISFPQMAFPFDNLGKEVSIQYH